MDVRISYGNQVVGVFDVKGMFMHPLFIKVANGQVSALVNLIRTSKSPVVYEDWDGHLITFEKVVVWR